MRDGLDIAFFGSSLLSAYWNGAATYYRGIIKGLHELGHRITFYEPDAFDRRCHRDIDNPEWAKVVVYPADSETHPRMMLREARRADILVKASGIGIFDALLEREILRLKTHSNLVVFWDVDGPATLDRAFNDNADPFRALIPEYDLILTYGGGDPVCQAYQALGARECMAVYHALDPQTHHPAPRQERFACDLAFLGNRLPDREARVEEFFFRPAAELSHRRFLLGGSGWQDRPMPRNVKPIGHVYTAEHNALNCSAEAVLNISRQSMAKVGFTPPPQIFEAAGTAACIITDAWDGIELFLEPNREILIAENGDDVVRIMRELTHTRARQVGSAARHRVLAEHTYAHRAARVAQLLTCRLANAIASRVSA